MIEVLLFSIKIRQLIRLKQNIWFFLVRLLVLLALVNWPRFWLVKASFLDIVVDLAIYSIKHINIEITISFYE